MYNSIPLPSCFENFHCKSFVFNEKEQSYTLIVQSMRPPKEVSCPKCNQAVHIHEHTSVTLKDMPPDFGTLQKIQVHIHRYRCTQCAHRFTEPIPFKQVGSRITLRAANWIKGFLKHRMSIKDICRITGIHWDTVSKIHKQSMDEEIKKRTKQLQDSGYRPKYLAVDEFAIHKGHTYATCVMDLEEGDILWVGSGRAMKDFRKFFEEIPSDYLSSVQAIAMDMNASYNRLVEEYLPHVAIIYDRYHMQAQYGKEVLGSIRLEEARKHQAQVQVRMQQMKQSQSKEEKKVCKIQRKEEQKKYTTLKKSRWTLLASRERLSASKRMQLHHILKEHRNIAICYALKEEMRQLFELRDVQEAARGWRESMVYGSKREWNSSVREVCRLKGKASFGAYFSCPSSNQYRKIRRIQ